MQNRYVGDIGDYLKLGILRALLPGHLLGVAWWLHPDESHNRDGRHIGYLREPDRWRRFDPELFDGLAGIVASHQRDVRAVAAANLLRGAIFVENLIPTAKPARQRELARREWFINIRDSLADADLLFVDPDNGLEPSGFSHGSAKAGKSILLTELVELAQPGRSLIVYHHQTRRAGGHHAELAYWAERLHAIGFSTVDVLRARPYSPRAYFLLDAQPVIRRRAEAVASYWIDLVTWHPDSISSREDHRSAVDASAASASLTGTTAPLVARRSFVSPSNRLRDC